MLKTADSHNPFSLFAADKSHKLSTRILQCVTRPMTRFAGLDECFALYSELPVRNRVSGFAEHALVKLGVGWSVDADALNAIPHKGAIIVVANHPFGGLEGLVLLAMLRKVRPDIKVLANPLLSRVPEMKDAIIPLDPFQTRAAKKRNVASLRQALAWLKQEGLVVIFPAGEVSHYHVKTNEVTDPEWQSGVGRLIRKSGAAALPVFFAGRNNLCFQLAGLLHPRLRTLLLPRQLVNKDGQMIDVKVGDVIPSSRFKAFAGAEEIAAYLRLRTYLLGENSEPDKQQGATKSSGKSASMCEVARPAPRSELASEVESLPETALMHEQGKFQVWCIRAAQGPLILREIGLLRELTFRQHNEGTGKSIDLDEFDDDYLHLFVWNNSEKEIVGAYRIGLSDEILLQHGVKGLYTNTLFRYRADLFEKLGPALEMGRSFVRPEYQKSFSSLLLLWQGIGRFLVKNPRYRFLFGPVSISQAYSDFSRQLMTSTLNEQLMVPELTRFVAPRLPVTVRKPKIKGCANKLTRALSDDLDRVDSLLADIEVDGKGIPVLLRHYLNLGGRMLAFNLDPEFSNVIDGLVLVELEKTPQKTLSRYMGKEGVEHYLSHQVKTYYEKVA